MGASFAWTFDQAFAGNVAPDAETTTVDHRGTTATETTRQRAASADVSRQATEVTGVSPNE